MTTDHDLHMDAEARRRAEGWGDPRTWVELDDTTDQQPIVTDDEIIGGILDELGTVSTRVDALADLAERVARMERMCADLAATLGGACRPPERTFTLEQARWVDKGDTIQAVHGDPMWAPVVGTVHTDDQTGLVTATADGPTRLRWWAPRDLVRVATPPVPDPAPYRAVR